MMIQFSKKIFTPSKATPGYEGRCFYGERGDEANFRLLDWLVADGDFVEKGTHIATVTLTYPEKIDGEILSPAEGNLTHYLQPRETDFFSHVLIGRIAEPELQRNIPKCLYVLYDSSYLMSDKKEDDVLILHTGLASAELTSLHRPISFIDLLEARQGVPILDVIHILPREVKEEINGLLKNDSKGKCASRARLICSNIIASTKYEDVELSKCPKYIPKDSLLGPDSETDRNLISWACDKAKNEPAIVYIASRDGGILTEICRLYREDNLCIFCHNTKPQLNIFLKQCWESIADQYIKKTREKSYRIIQSSFDLCSDPEFEKLFKDRRNNRFGQN